MKHWFKYLYLTIVDSFKKKVIGNVLYRNLIIVKAYPKYTEAKRFFFGKQLTTTISPPDSFYQDIPKEIEETIGVYSPSRKHCKIFKYCLIIGGNQPMVFNHNGKPLWNAIAYQFFNFERNYSPFKWFIRKKKISKITNKSYGFLLYTHWHTNYFHWLLDNLARLEFLDYFDDPSRVTVYTHNSLLPFQKDSLSALEIKNIERIGDSSIRVKHLLVPNFPLEQQGYDIEQIYWLREKIWSKFGILDATSILQYKNILILRKPSSGRCFLNQKEVIEALKELQFKGYYLEDLTFKEQVVIFSQANCVIGVHGAGLANIIFAKKSISLIEIFGSKVFPCYFQLAKNLGFKYGYIISESDTQENTKQSNIKINIDLLLQIINNLSVCKTTNHETNQKIYSSKASIDMV